MKMKKWMTEILLTVTTEEIEGIAAEVYKKEKAKAVKGRSVWIK